jgi:hypothetical protein
MADQAQRPSRWDGFEAANGFVRDGLAALRNLENLLKSPRIGPRALEQVVAELRPGSRPLGDAFLMLIDLIDAREPKTVSAALRTFTRERIESLDEAIDRASGSDMGAKARLRLEAQVVKLGGELDALRDLVDLLDAATTILPTELDLNALTTEALGKLAPSSAKHPRLAKVAYAAAPDSATVVTDPRVVMPLLAAALAMLVSNNIRSIHVSASIDDRGGTLLICRPHANGQPANIPCVPPRVIAPTLDVARTAASLAGAELVFDEPDNVVRVMIPASQATESVVRHDAQAQD